MLLVDVIIKNKGLNKLEAKADFDGGHEGIVIKAFRKRMQQIRAAIDERDFYNLKSLRFERLKGNRQHQYSMRLNDQWRLILEFTGKAPNKTVTVVCIEDYH